MSKNILTAIACITQEAVEVEEKLEDFDPHTTGCPSCGYLTKENIDADQEYRALISHLSELSEALDYLETLI